MGELLVLPERFNDIHIPVKIRVGDESNTEWIYKLYELVLSEVIGYDKFDEDTEVIELEEDIFDKCFIWLEQNLFEYLPTPRHLFEIAFGFGNLASIEGLSDYIPLEYLPVDVSDMLNDVEIEEE